MKANKMFEGGLMKTIKKKKKTLYLIKNKKGVSVGIFTKFFLYFFSFIIFDEYIYEVHRQCIVIRDRNNKICIIVCK